MSLERPWIRMDGGELDYSETRPDVDRHSDPTEEKVPDAMPAFVVDEDAQRDMLEHDVHEQSRGLDPSARHAMHDAPGAAPTSASESERIRGETRGLDDLMAYRGKNLLAADGALIGDIIDVYTAGSTGQPEWLAAIVHGLRPRCVVVPVRGSYLFAGAISVPYTRDQALLSATATDQAAPDHGRAEHLRRLYGLPDPDILADEERRRDAASVSWKRILLATITIVVLAGSVAGATLAVRRRARRSC